MEGADCEGDNLLIWGKKDFKLFDVAALLEPSTAAKRPVKAIEQNSLGQQRLQRKKAPAVEEGPMRELPVKNFARQVNQIKQTIEQARKQKRQNINVEEEQGDLEVYNYTLIDVTLRGNKIIAQVKDDDTEYIKIYDFKREILLNYIEFD